MPDDQREPLVIADWCINLVHGIGGLDDFERYELPAWSDRDVAIVEFVLRSLANPRCQDADRVLAAIHERRI